MKFFSKKKGGVVMKTTLMALLALIDFWACVILAIMSRIGKIGVPIWQVFLVCSVIMIVLILGMYFSSIEEFGDGREHDDGNDWTPVERKVR